MLTGPMQQNVLADRELLTAQIRYLRRTEHTTQLTRA